MQPGDVVPWGEDRVLIPYNKTKNNMITCILEGNQVFENFTWWCLSFHELFPKIVMFLFWTKKDSLVLKWWSVCGLDFLGDLTLHPLHLLEKLTPWWVYKLPGDSVFSFWRSSFSTSKPNHFAPITICVHGANNLASQKSFNWVTFVDPWNIV